MKKILSLLTKKQFDTIKRIAEENRLDMEEFIYYCVYKSMYYCETTSDKIKSANLNMHGVLHYFSRQLMNCFQENPDLECWRYLKAESFRYFLEDYHSKDRAEVQKVQKIIQAELEKEEDKTEPCGKFEDGLFGKPLYFHHQTYEYEEYYEKDYTFPEYILHKILTPSIEKPDAADILMNCVEDLRDLLKKCFKNHPKEMAPKILTKEEIVFLNDTILPRVFYYAELWASLVDEKSVEE